MTIETHPCPCELHEALAADPNLAIEVAIDPAPNCPYCHTTQNGTRVLCNVHAEVAPAEPAALPSLSDTPGPVALVGAAQTAAPLAPLLSTCRRCGEPSPAWICGACEVPPDPSANRRTLEALIRAALEMRAFLAEPTPYDAALVSLARAVRREHVISLSSDQFVADEYADAPEQFLQDFDQMTPAQQARVSLRVARAWGMDVSIVDQLWVESREKLAELAALA